MIPLPNYAPTPTSQEGFFLLYFCHARAMGGLQADEDEIESDP
jgi:hypothetical protein